MENASKALIMAGAILISLLVISLGVFLFTRSRGAVKENAKQLTVEEMEVFNKQFMEFDKGKLYGSQIIKLMQRVQASNAKYKDRKVKLNGSENPDQKTITETKLYEIKLERQNGIINKITVSEL